jgi:hypothetical protein
VALDDLHQAGLAGAAVAIGVDRGGVMDRDPGEVLGGDAPAVFGDDPNEHGF